MTPEEILIEQNITYNNKGHSHIISCLNPEHEDIHPSMHVNKTTGIAHCFSCKTTLNIFSRFNKVVNSLSVKQQNILNLINSIDIIKYAIPTDAHQFSEEYRNIRPSTYEHFNVFKSDSVLPNRIVLPIYNFKHEIVSFIGRYQHSKIDPKYKVYPEGRMLPLFPPAVDIDSDSIVLVEGMFDLLNLYDKGITNAVTGFGLVTSNKNDKFNTKLHERFMPYKIAGINTIYILYDGDTAGIKAAENLETALNEFISVELIELKDGLDPGRMTDKHIELLKVRMNK